MSLENPNLPMYRKKTHVNARIGEILISTSVIDTPCDEEWVDTMSNDITTTTMESVGCRGVSILFKATHLLRMRLIVY